MNPYPFIYLKPESGTPFGWSLSVWAILGIACEQAFGRFFPQTESLFTGYFREYPPGTWHGFIPTCKCFFLSTNSLRYEIIFYSPEALFCFSHFTYLLSRALLSVQKERSDTRNYVYVNRRAVPKIIYFLQRVTS